ncbi:SDR family oxidoreductase [Curvivirga aplysinae]|uniref:SDR family oxidoreductase n=1 Tax=Curvivirga aplysinae TaxID=2529852 RepID=UPI0012BC5AAA|nr:SDR family oxidoreductase [Curvivirga aplysinae]MTI08194.1 SDR family oxidoreductase [Curvivirga aplysinae]
MNLSSKKALVFGGTSGIGLATCKQLADLGADVIAISRHPEKAGDLGDNISTRKCDVRDADALKALFKECGPYDILISAATGGSRAKGPFLEMDMDSYQASFDKLWGYTNAVRYGTEYLSEKGNIVLVSGAPARKCRPGQIALASVGGAVEAFVRAIAPELAPRRINVVSPGLISTPMFGDDVTVRDAQLADMTKDNLIPRPGQPEEVAKGILFVVQNEFVTGTTVDVDGGWLLS